MGVLGGVWALQAGPQSVLGASQQINQNVQAECCLWHCSPGIKTGLTPGNDIKRKEKRHRPKPIAPQHPNR